MRRILRDLAVPFFHHEFVKQVSSNSVGHVRFCEWLAVPPFRHEFVKQASSGLWTGMGQQVEVRAAGRSAHRPRRSQPHLSALTALTVLH